MKEQGRFVQVFAGLDFETRFNIGHRPGTTRSEVFDRDVEGLISSCLFKGESCEDEKYVNL